MMSDTAEKLFGRSPTFLVLVAAGVVLGAGAYLFFVHDRIAEEEKRERVSLITSRKAPRPNRWNIQCIDTMKESRDRARGKLRDASYDSDISRQVRAIAETGANFVAVDTPYDEEFVPFLRRWVRAARDNGLGVWFRGNWSGWEGWFDYPKNMSWKDHIRETKNFIAKNPDIFSDGDIFSPCPECENGGPGDPRQKGTVAEYRKFIIEEYDETGEAFASIGKNIRVFYPSNRDVAKLVMDVETTRALGGFVVIDHYVNDPVQIARDVEDIARTSGGTVVLGEFGAPFDGRSMITDDEQAQWIEDVLRGLSDLKNFEGVNYWIHTGGPTELWKENGDARSSVALLRDFFLPRIVYGTITDGFLCPVRGARISSDFVETFSGSDGGYELRNGDISARKIYSSASGFSERIEPVDFSDTRIIRRDIILGAAKSPSPFESISVFPKCR